MMGEVSHLAAGDIKPVEMGDVPKMLNHKHQRHQAQKPFQSGGGTIPLESKILCW